MIPQDNAQKIRRHALACCYFPAKNFFSKERWLTRLAELRQG